MKKLICALWLIFPVGCESSDVYYGRLRQVRFDYVNEHIKEMREAEANMFAEKILEARPLMGILVPNRKEKLKDVMKEIMQEHADPNEKSFFAFLIKKGSIMEGMTLKMVDVACDGRLRFEWEGAGYESYEVEAHQRGTMMQLDSIPGVSIRFTVPVQNCYEFHLTFKDGILVDWTSFTSRGVYYDSYGYYQGY